MPTPPEGIGQRPALFACDHAVPMLATKGIVPTAVVSMDGSGHIWSDLYEGVPLIAAVTADPCLTFSWKGPVYFLAQANETMLASVRPWWPKFECLLDNCRTVGGSMMSFVMDNLRPSTLRFFGYDYCWKYSEKQHAMGLSFRCMESAGTISMKGWLGSNVRTYTGFYQDAILIKCRMIEYQLKTKARYLWHGESIVPTNFPDATQEECDRVSKDLHDATVAALGVRWRGAGRANAMHPDRNRSLSEFMRSMDGTKEAYLIGAGPSLDETMPELLDLLGMRTPKEEPCLAK